jgi:hypothetical protein
MVFNIQKQYKYFSNSKYIKKKCFKEEWMNELHEITRGEMSSSISRQWSQLFLLELEAVEGV